jgi:predicted PurR-regulated permease PerM
MAITPKAAEEPRLLRLLTGIATFFAFILVVACLSWGSAVLIPVALSLLLTFLLAPLVNIFQRSGLNRTASIILVVLCTGIFLASVGWVITTQVTRLAHDLRYNPTYKKQIREKLADLQRFSRGGLLDNFQVTADHIMGEIEKSTPDPSPPPPIVVREETSPLTTLQTTLQPFLEPLGAAALVVVLVIFMLLEYGELRNRFIGLMGAEQLTVTTKALADAGERISHYLLMQLFINGSYGLAAGVGLFFFGVPYAILWGFLAALLRYVPYVGPWIAAVFPITISLVAFDGWWQPGLVIGLFVVLELVSNMIMEPWLYGQSIGVSQVGLLVVTGFWTWLWGPIGLVLSTPLTVCIIVLGQHVPQLRFFDVLLRDQPVLDPPVVLYQRLLARDQEEAAEVVEEYVRANPGDSVYDELLIPALLLAWQDRRHKTLTGEDEAFVLQAMREILEELQMSLPTKENDPAVSTTPMARVLPSPVHIFGFPAHHEAEEVIIQMLRTLQQRDGYDVEMVSTRTHATDVVDRIRQASTALIFIAALPGGLPQTRYLCAYLRKACPELPIVVGYWGNKEAFDKNLTRLRQAGASYLVTSLQQGHNRLRTLSDEGAQRKLPGEVNGQMSDAREHTTSEENNAENFVNRG